MANNSGLVISSLFHAIHSTPDIAVLPQVPAGLLLGYSLLGLATFAWAFWSQRSRLPVFKKSFFMSFTCRHGKLSGVQNVHSSLISLLSIDALNVITAIILGIQLAGSACCSPCGCVCTFIICFLSRWLGVIAHLQTALVALNYLSHPQLRAKLHLIVMGISFSIAAVIPVYIFITQVAIFLLGAIIIILALAIIANCEGSSLPRSALAQKKLIVLVSMCTLLVTYIPSFILQCMILSLRNWVAEYEVIYTYVLFFTNCHLVFDGLQSYLILRLSAGEEEEQRQQQQQHVEPGTDYL